MQPIEVIGHLVVVSLVVIRGYIPRFASQLPCVY